MVPNLRFDIGGHHNFLSRHIHRLFCRLSEVSVSAGDSVTNPVGDIGSKDGGESMWEDAGEEDDCDFGDDDDVDGRGLGDPEVKELMSEILGKEEADEVLHQVRLVTFDIPKVSN